jgi:hypothetical protein
VNFILLSSEDQESLNYFYEHCPFLFKRKEKQALANRTLRAWPKGTSRETLREEEEEEEEQNMGQDQADQT